MVMDRRRWIVWVLSGAGLAACDNPPDDVPGDEVRQRLVGTWLREYEDGDTRVRRVLVLAQDGSFREASRLVGPAAPESHSGAGDWVFDGTNLKRKYARIDGKPVSAPTMPFATFEISFKSRHEFAGVDHVRRLEVLYRRVEDDLQP